MAPVGAVVTAAAGKEVFKRLVGDVYEFLKRETGKKIKQWDTEYKIDTLYKKIYDFRKVKTIWQVDKAVDLMTFYCDSHVIMGDKRIKVTNIDDVGTKENLLIQGIAGQGKSIFLRYLCSVELSLGRVIPLFLELRRVNKDEPLRDRIHVALKSLGLTVDDELFEALSASGKILLLLDAFDEVPDALKSKVLADIDDLAATKPNLRIIVTSRPNNGIETSNTFRVVTLDNLRNGEYVKVINKLSDNRKWAKNLIQHIQSKSKNIKGMLATPLMVTLLVISYKSYQKLPNKLSDFYDALFQTLLQRHDGTKPGFKRDRACTLDDGEYRQVFETLCILTKKRGKQTFSYAEIYDLTKDAIRTCGFNENAQKYINDIVRITCLLLKDGEEYRYIHKTVQEYYTASYIRGRPESWVITFYTRIIDSQSYREWQKELDFLSEIDNFRFNKYYKMNTILEFLDLKKDDLYKEPKKPKIVHIRNLLSRVLLAHLDHMDPQKESENLELAIFLEDFGDTVYMEFIERIVDFLQPESGKYGISLDEMNTIKHRNRKKHVSQKRRAVLKVGMERSFEFSGDELMYLDRYKKNIMNIFETYSNELIVEARRIAGAINEQENVSLLDDLI